MEAQCFPFPCLQSCDLSICPNVSAFSPFLHFYSLGRIYHGLLSGFLQQPLYPSSQLRDSSHTLLESVFFFFPHPKFNSSHAPLATTCLGLLRASAPCDKYRTSQWPQRSHLIWVHCVSAASVDTTDLPVSHFGLVKSPSCLQFIGSKAFGHAIWCLF